MELKIVSHLYNLVAIDANARVYRQDDHVEVLCELANRTENLVASALVAAVGYDPEGWIVAIAETDRCHLFPGQIRPVRLLLHPRGEQIHAIRLFPLVASSCR